MKRVMLLVAVVVLGFGGSVSSSVEQVIDVNEEELVRLRAENKVLRATTRRLSDELDTLRAKVKWLIGMALTPNPIKIPPGPTVQELTQQDEVLADEIQGLQMQVNLGRAKVSKLIRATVDMDLILPYRGSGIGVGRRIPGGKKGDFRTEHERAMAVQAAREEAMPSEIELVLLKKQQVKLRSDLVKARAELKYSKRVDVPIEVSVDTANDQ